MHTPGPWHVQGASIISDAAITVATVPIGTGAGQANVNLIAAAPDLLDDGHALMVAVFEWINGADNGSQLEDQALALEATLRKAKEK